MMQMLSLENEVIRSYFFYSTILILKMMFMSGITSTIRLTLKIFISSEDAKIFNGTVAVDERIERRRRAHLNDLENIPLFFVVGFIYCLTNPIAFFAKALFLTYTVARIGHTFVYAIVPIPQPVRAICWGIGYIITGYMAIVSLIYFI